MVLKIGLDFDGVLSDCGLLKSRGAKELYGVNILPGDFKKELVISNGWLTREQYRAVQQKVYATDFGLQMEPVNDMLWLVPRLQQDHLITVITSRSKDSLRVAQEWARLQGLSVDFVGVGRGSKADAATGYEVFVDDDLDKLQPLIGLVPHLYLFGWPYNQHLDPGHSIVRISSWQELYARIQSIAP